MNDYLKEFCLNLGIDLIYTDNKITVLSSTTPQNVPTIRVHNIFKNCSEELAREIVDYYTNYNSLDKSYKLITDYIQKKFHSDRYKIKKPDKEFKNLIISKMNDVTFLNNKTSNYDEQSSLVEFNIVSMTKKNFQGDYSEIDPEQSIDLSEEDIVNLDIYVEDWK